ncbi:hypothetical protein GGS24DRAFT_492957 [Hypoxylon argillaceum]|nr:hypothetical protein GGS24DRAFT_492957 [Hypoxylon argillaceum]
MASETALRPQSPVTLPLTTFLFITSSSAALTSQFQHFYPQHGPKYEYILHHNCSQHQFSVLVEPVVNCLLNNVTLGVTPPLLATLGASTDELALLNVVGRRPELALLISFGNPSVYMERVFDFRQPENMLQRSRGRYRAYVPDTTFKRWLVVGLYWQLGVWTVCCWWPETAFGPLVWTILSVPIHLAGTFAIRLRVCRIYTDEEKTMNIGFSKRVPGIPQRLSGYLRSEWAPAGAQDEIRTVPFEEGKLYVAWSWLLSTATGIHILFGSLILSGLLFIRPRDALLVIFRYVLAGMRARYVLEPDRKGSFEVVKLED